MGSLWQTVFSPQPFIPHGHCYLWQTNLVSLHVLSDGFTAIAYYSIPLMLLYFVRQRQNVPFKRIFILFSAFIITCGTTHLVEIWTLWHPAYWLSGLVKAVTALVSIYTALELYPVIPQALAIPSQETLQAINQSLAQEITERKAIEEELKSQRDFNQLVAEVTSHFVDLDPQNLDIEIKRILQLVGEFTGAEFSYVFKFTDNYSSMSMTHEWNGISDQSFLNQAQNLPWEAFPWSNQQYLNKQVLYVPKVENLPPEAAVDQAGWQSFNLTSLLAIPLIQGTGVTGFIGFASFSQEIHWQDKAIETLKIVGRTVANVQERLQTYKQLQESESRFRQVVESIQEIFFIRDFPSLTLRYVSPVTEAILGLAAADMYADPFLLFQHIHPDDRDRIQSAIETIHIAETTPLNLEFRFNRPDQQMRWMNAKVVPLKANNETVYRLIGVANDITAEKHAEHARIQNQKLKLELNLLENILDIILAGYWDWDILGHRKYYSPGFKRMFGYADHELANCPDTWKQLIFLEDLPKALASFEEHVCTRGQIPYYCEARYRHKDGSTIWIADSGDVIEWGTQGQPLRMIGCHLDITKQKLAQAEVQQKALMFENSSDGIIITNLNGRITDWNQAATAMFGYSKADVLGRSPSILHHLHETQTLTRHILNGMKETEKWQGEVNFIRKDGTGGTCETIVVPLKDQAGKMVATLGVNRDISDRKAREAQIQAALAEKEVMLQEIHHRVKNNLQIVSSLLNLQAKQTQNQHLSGVLIESQNRVRSMALLHEKLYRSPNLSQIHFGDYVQDLTGTLLRTYRNSEVVIKLNVNIEEIHLTIDIAMPCGLIINELVSNALKYAFLGQNEGIVAIKMTTQPHSYWLTIEDNGIGLPADFTLDRVNTLGLQMVCTLARQLSGRIDIQQKRGTRFLLQFPR